MWSFRQAPPEFQNLFPEGRDSDWLAHVPETERHAVGPSMLKWRPVYPVNLAELVDRSIVYFGALSQATDRLSERLSSVMEPRSPGQERRSAVRVKFECPSRYETSTRVGSGHTIDMSSTGIAFTTETLLARNTKIALHVSWPIRLEGGVPVALYATGELVRAEPTKAAIQVDRIGFSVAV